MPLQEYKIWENPPGVETIWKKGFAEILQLKSHKDFSEDHYLKLEIYKTKLSPDCGACLLLFPLIVGMWEKDGNNSSTDFYSFDRNGLCLSHGYSRTKDGERIVNEEHDTDISKLIEYGEIIQEMIGEYPTPAELGTHNVVIDLMKNCLIDRNK